MMCFYIMMTHWHLWWGIIRAAVWLIMSARVLILILDLLLMLWPKSLKQSFICMIYKLSIVLLIYKMYKLPKTVRLNYPSNALYGKLYIFRLNSEKIMLNPSKEIFIVLVFAYIGSFMGYFPLRLRRLMS
jgi:hypothetical protein